MCCRFGWQTWIFELLSRYSNALRASLDQGILGYDLQVKALQEVAAARMERLYGWHVDPDMIVATPGIVSGFNAAAWAACDPGEGILMQVPVYFPFLSVGENVGLVQQTAPLRPVRQGSTIRYDLDFEAFKGAIHSGGVKTRMFLLCNPHNPTGNMFDRDELSEMARLCLERDVLICSDEIHSELVLSDRHHVPIASLSAEIADRTITLIAPSKTFNVAGLFCGLAIIPNEKLRERFKKQVERLTLHVNSLGIVSAQTALSGSCDAWLAELCTYLRENRDIQVRFVQERLPGMRTTIPEATYLAWLDCGDLVAPGVIKGSPFDFFLVRAKVALNNGVPFGPGGEDFVRLNFGCPRSTLIQALERMEKALYRR